MGRLIDEDVLLARISLNYNNHQNITACAMKDIINTTPTAYDVDANEYINTSTEYINSSIGGWIPCSERLPEAEERVLIFAKRKYKGGGFRNIITTAIYEDGTVLENDSNWHWEDIDGEWDEEEDCYIIPEGWWEDKQYNPDGVLNYAVDDKVIAWMPLPEPYTAPPTSAWKEQTMNRFERVE